MKNIKTLFFLIKIFFILNANAGIIGNLADGFKNTVSNGFNNIFSVNNRFDG